MSNIINKIRQKQPESVGALSFDSFLEACESLGSVLDDATLAAHADKYKVYMSWAEDKDKFQKALDSKSSLELASFHLKNNIAEDAKCAAYYSLYMTTEWFMEYGITDGKKLFMVGRFKFNQSVFDKLPDHAMLITFKNWFSELDMREHTILNSARRDMRTMYVGPCTQTPPEVYDAEVSVMCMGLGAWSRVNGILQLDPGEARRIFDEFRTWAVSKKWAKHCDISMRPWKDGRVQLAVKLSNL